jgi:hypothetical protein
VELNLDSARAAREVELLIKQALARLPAAVQKDVIERVAVDVLAALSPSNGKSHANGTAAAAARPGVESKRPTDGPQTHWERIAAYCQSHPTSNGKFRTADLTEALMPDKLKENRAVALSTIYTAIKRRSLGETTEPSFVWLGKGKFRLATPEERAKAKL